MRYRRAQARGGACFLTVVTFARRKFLADSIPLSILREAFTRTMAERPFAVDAWVILPEGGRDFPFLWRFIKARFTHAWKEMAAPGQYNPVKHGYVEGYGESVIVG